LTFKQLSSSSYISTMNFMKDDKVDSKYLPTKLWKADRIRLFQNVRMKVATTEILAIELILRWALMQEN